MDLASLKLLSSLVSPVKWLYALCVDQTRIEVVAPCVKGWPNTLLPVENKQNGGGLLLFAVTSRSRGPVEITRVEVAYATPLQLLDPGNRGFFVGSGTLDDELPFSMSWEGSAVVRSDLLQGFALTARFSPPVYEHRVRISVYARARRTTIGSFTAHGRSRVTTSEYRVRLTSEAVLGLTIPPKCGYTTPQPFLIESEWKGSGTQGPIQVHERFADGTVSSHRVDLRK